MDSSSDLDIISAGDVSVMKNVEIMKTMSFYFVKAIDICVLQFNDFAVLVLVNKTGSHC